MMTGWARSQLAVHLRPSLPYFPDLVATEGILWLQGPMHCQCLRLSNCTQTQAYGYVSPTPHHWGGTEPAKEPLWGPLQHTLCIP